MSGCVYLVGAGPGDRGLLTLRAVECLRRADVVIYDRLADAHILQLASAAAEYIYVGKAASHHTMCQEEINDLLVERAQSGHCVVRLKGGDPFVFGRGGEEALALQKLGLPFEIVPGVTSAVAVPAYAGIPVTHRGVAASFAVVTGHEAASKAGSSLRWDKLAAAVDTLVFLMGVSHLPDITAQLMAHGRSPETPAALIRWGTKPEQRVLVTTVGEAAAAAVRAKLRPPAILVVGEVVKLRQKLAWFDSLRQRPLFGRTILVTRDRTQAAQLVRPLEELGARCIEVPVLRIADPPDGGRALQQAIARLAVYQWIVFTSVNGVERFFAQLFASQRDVRALGMLRVAAIGPATAERLRGYGIVADIVPEEFRAEAVVAAMTEQLKPGQRVLLPRAVQARAALPDGLRQLGAVVDVVPAYEAVRADVDADGLRRQLAAGEIDLVTFTSSSTVTNLLEVLGEAVWPPAVKTACIGPVTAQTCKNCGIRPDVVAACYTVEGLVQAIREDAEQHPSEGLSASVREGDVDQC